MSTELARREPQQLSVDQLRYVANTDLIPKSYRGNVPAILACVLTGRELGIPDLHALRAIHVVDGKPTLSAELMVTLARRAGHSITGEVTDIKARVTGVRGDNGDTMTCEWTLDMASQAELLGKQNWRKYPQAMLWARAVSQLCRMLFPDVVLGVGYTPDELGADDPGPGERPPVEGYDDEWPLVEGELVDEDAAGPLAAPAGGGPVGTGAVAGAAPAAAEAAAPGGSSDPDTGGASGEGNEPGQGAAAKPATAAQKKKLNVLVGRLRDAGRITTDQVYMAVARDRGVDQLDLMGAGRDEDGVLHWRWLREQLGRDEAHGLIDRLEKLEAGAS